MMRGVEGSLGPIATKGDTAAQSGHREKCLCWPSIYLCFSFVFFPARTPFSGFLLACRTTPIYPRFQNGLRRVLGMMHIVL